MDLSIAHDSLVSPEFEHLKRVLLNMIKIVSSVNCVLCPNLIRSSLAFYTSHGWTFDYTSCDLKAFDNYIY